MGTIERVATSLASHGLIARGYLGLGLQTVPIDDGSDTMGAIVMTIDREGPGAAAGIRQGDVIAQWNGRSISALRDIARELGSGSVGTRVHLTGRPGGQQIDFDVTVAARPDT